MKYCFIPRQMDIYNERQKEIINLVENKGFVSVKNLSDHLNVSLVTIRKDLTLLEDEGFLYRTHGGATKRKRYVFEKPVIEKELIQVDEKVRIAKKAMSLISEKDFLLLASGTTIYFLAQQIKSMNNLTVCTPSLNVSMVLAGNPQINTIQIGGELRHSSKSVVGSLAEKSIQQFSSHLLFLGVDGIDLNFGISTSNSAEAQLNQVMIQQSDKVVVLADSSKINKRGFGKIANLDEVDILITTSPVNETFIESIEELGIEVYVV